MKAFETEGFSSPMRTMDMFFLRGSVFVMSNFVKIEGVTRMPQRTGEKSPETRDPSKEGSKISMEGCKRYPLINMKDTGNDLDVRGVRV